VNAPYWAWVPSKTLLRAPEARTEPDRAQRVTTPDLDWADLRNYRNYLVRHLDDPAQVTGYQDQGVTVIKGRAAFTGPRTVTVANCDVSADNILIATGSEPTIPPIAGLADEPVSTNREATNLTEIRHRAVIVGDSAVEGRTEHLPIPVRNPGHHRRAVRRPAARPRSPRVGELVAAQLTDAGVAIHTSSTARRARREDGDTIVTVADGNEVRVDVIILGAGRRPARLTSVWTEGASPPMSGALSRSMRAAPATAFGRSATSPPSCPTPRSVPAGDGTVICTGEEASRDGDEWGAQTGIEGSRSRSNAN
jgi:pyridine nucleotide-disulfide oxidoreductase